MKSVRGVNELAPGLEAFGAVRPFLGGNPGLLASALAAAVVLLGAALSWFPTFFGPDTRLGSRDLVGLVAIAAVLAVLFYGTILARAWDLAGYDDPALPPLASRATHRLLLLLAVLAVPSLALLAVTAQRVPAAGLALLGIGLLITLELATFFAPHAMLVEGLSFAAALRRSGELVAPNLGVVARYAGALTALGALPLLLAWLAFDQVIAARPSGVVGLGDIDLWVMLGATLAVVGFTVVLLFPPIVATTIFRAASASPAASPARSSAERTEARNSASGRASREPATAGELFNKAMGLLAVGEPSRAMEMLALAIEREPSLGEGERYATACLELGEVCAANGQSEAAASYFESFLRLTPAARNREHLEARIARLRAGAGGA